VKGDWASRNNRWEELLGDLSPRELKEKVPREKQLKKGEGLEGGLLRRKIGSFPEIGKKGNMRNRNR